MAMRSTSHQTSLQHWYMPNFLKKTIPVMCLCVACSLARYLKMLRRTIAVMSRNFQTKG